MDKVDDQVLATLASVDQTSGGLLSVLIAERAMATGFQLPLLSRCVTSFLAPVEAAVDKIMHDARQHMH